MGPIEKQFTAVCPTHTLESPGPVYSRKAKPKPFLVDRNFWRENPNGGKSHRRIHALVMAKQRQLQRVQGRAAHFGRRDKGKRCILLAGGLVLRDRRAWGTTEDGYGAGLGDMIGSVQGSVPANIILRVLLALSYYQNLQSQQAYLTNEERLLSVQNVTSSRVAGSRTDYLFSVFISTGKDTQPTNVCVRYRPNL